MFSLWVAGTPRPAGSKRAFRNRGPGRKFIIADDCKAGPAWKAMVKLLAREYWAGKPAIAGPVLLILDFKVSRPKRHFGTGANAGRIKTVFVKAWPTVKPDTTKFVRAVEDALTGVAWNDDAQVVRQIAQKRYAGPGEQAGVTILVFPATVSILHRVDPTFTVESRA